MNVLNIYVDTLLSILLLLNSCKLVAYKGVSIYVYYEYVNITVKWE